MSKEHLWPSWARATLLDTEKDMVVPHSIESSEAVSVREWDAPAFSATLKRVCLQCNNGWMSDLEHRAQPYATPLILGTPTTVDASAQRSLAIWAYLKCLLFVTVAGGQLADVYAVASKTFFEIQSHDLLPLHTSVFVAHHVGPRQGQYQCRLLGKPDRPVCFVQTFTIKQLTIQVVNNYLVRAPIEFERDPRLGNVDQRIWPTGADFDWPMENGLDDAGLTIYTGPQVHTAEESRRAQRTRKKLSPSARRNKRLATKRARRRGRRG
ncbi:MAG: hypothetical protein H0U42_06785 [Thermoleophilaceae bacterium]|nr:hypothetical protein [Thermoleophilaceae bacterium]